MKAHKHCDEKLLDYYVMKCNIKQCRWRVTDTGLFKQYTSLKHTLPAALVDVHLPYMVNCSYYIEEDSSHLMIHTLEAMLLWILLLCYLGDTCCYPLVKLKAFSS